MFHSISFSPHTIYNPMETPGNSYNTESEETSRREQEHNRYLASLAGLLALTRPN
mgnify:CR=1 FL=1